MRDDPDTCELLCLDLPKAEAVRQALPEVDALSGVASRAKALSDPTRVRVALALAEGGDLCVCDLAWVLERQEQLVSHHLRVLRSAGLAQSRKDGRMVHYSLTDAGRRLLALAVDPLPAVEAGR